MAATVWTPTAANKRDGVPAFGELVMLCREGADCDGISRALVHEFNPCGLRALGAVTPYVTGGGLPGYATDETVTLRTGTATGAVVDF